MVFAYPDDPNASGIPWAFRCGPCAERYNFSYITPVWGGEKSKGFIIADEMELRRRQERQKLLVPAPVPVTVTQPVEDEEIPF